MTDGYPDLLDRLLSLARTEGPVSITLFTSGKVEILVPKKGASAYEGTFEEAARKALATPSDGR